MTTGEERRVPGDTRAKEYAERLLQLETLWWKRALGVQLPYRMHLRRLALGRTLDVGCGIGRNLLHLPPGSLGVDHNPHSVEVAVSRGVDAVTADEFMATAPDRLASFDSLLAAHVIEHVTPDDALALLRQYVPLIRPGGRVVLICPQERGYASDSTHVTFVQAPELRLLCLEAGLMPERDYSFPLPRAAGRRFLYNETVVVSRVPSA